MKFTKLEGLGVAAFAFTTREKDYGGLHLVVGTGDVEILVALIAELGAAAPGHSRSLRLTGVPSEVPERIFARGAWRAFDSLRLGRAEDGGTRVEAGQTSAAAFLDGADLRHLERLVREALSSGGDQCIAGRTSSWTDRLWVWPR